jgi:hypothetical protein
VPSFSKKEKEIECPRPREGHVLSQLLPGLGLNKARLSLSVTRYRSELCSSPFVKLASLAKDG